jgi:hypothetical protein
MPPSNDFIAHFDLGLETYRQQRTAGLARFQNHTLNRASHALLVVIFVEFLLLALAQEVRNIVTFADKLRSDGSLARNRVIYPDLKGLRSMFTSSIHGLRDEIFGNHESMPFPPNCECTKSRFFSVPFALLAAIARFFRTDYAVFGLRAGCAAFAGSVPAFIATSATFYLQYRGVWIIIVLILGVNPTTGASLNSLLVQCSGTLLGGLLAMAVWYMVDQNVAGVIVFTFVVNVFRNSPLYGSSFRFLLLNSRSSKGRTTPLMHC